MDENISVALILSPAQGLHREMAVELARQARDLRYPWTYRTFWGGEEVYRSAGVACQAVVTAPGLFPRVSSACLETIPVIQFSGGNDRLCGDAIDPWVHTESESIGRLGAEYLHSLGFERLAFIGGRNPRQVASSLSIDRGFREQCLKDHIACWTYTWAPDRQNVDASLVELRDWISGIGKPVGILTQDDAIGRCVMRACNQLRLHVPTDVAILGGDKDDLFWEVAGKPLSSIDHDIRSLAEGISVLLYRAVFDGGVPRTTTVKIAPRGVVSRGTECSIRTTNVSMRQPSGNGQDHSRENVNRYGTAHGQGTSSRAIPPEQSRRKAGVHA